MDLHYYFFESRLKHRSFKGILGREGVEHRLSGVDKVAGDLIQGDLSEGDVSIDERVEKRIPVERHKSKACSTPM